MKKKTTEQFIREAEMVHGVGTFDYSEVEYVNDSTPIIITCNICGHRWETTPNKHLRYGCPECAILRTRKPVYGVGINDYPGHIKNKGVQMDSYTVWFSMIGRLYNPKVHNREPSYKQATLHTDWIRFSNFKEWFDKNSQYYHKGWQLDKDLLIKGNKTYSPDTCTFLPLEINSALITRPAYRTSLPIGVQQTKSGRYHASLSKSSKKREHLGTFDSIEEAFSAYKSAKESWLKFLANKYKSELDPRAYKALMEYEVSITD